MSDTSDHKPAGAQPQDAAGGAAPEEVQPGHDPLLEQAVEDLLQQMDEAEKNIKAAVAEETQQDLADLAAMTNASQSAAEQPADTATKSPEEDNLTDVVNALLEQQDQPGSAVATTPAVAAKEPETPAPAEEVAAAPVAEAAAAVENVAEQTPEPAVETPKAEETKPEVAQVAEAAPPQASEAAKPEVTPTLADLDRELAGVANEMLAKEQIAAPAPVPAAPAPARTPEPAPEPVAQEPAHPIPASKEHHAASAGTRAQQAKAAMHTAIAHASPKAKAAGSWLKVHVEPKVIAMLAVVSKPIATKSNAFKHSLGLIALYTLFVASAFWAYALFLRPSHVQTAEAEPFDFQKSGLPTPEPEQASHEEAASENAHGKAESGGHGEAKKEEGHGGGGHGDAKGGKKEVKKPVLNSADSKSVINKTLEDRKKKPGEAKKGGGGGHGGGH